MAGFIPICVQLLTMIDTSARSSAGAPALHNPGTPDWDLPGVQLAALVWMGLCRSKGSSASLGERAQGRPEVPPDSPVGSGDSGLVGRWSLGRPWRSWQPGSQGWPAQMASVVAGRQQAGFIGSPAHPAGTASFQDCINHFCARLFSPTLVVSSVPLNIFMEVFFFFY